jgi:AGZA family xanthine/uracil permease-like MFS transporter
VILKAAGVDLAGVAIRKSSLLCRANNRRGLQVGHPRRFNVGFIPVLLTVFLMDFVDTMGTLIGVSERAGLLDENGDMPQIEKPMMADAVATVVGALAGTSTTGSFIESATGGEEGGRTGMTALVVALLFVWRSFSRRF